MTVSLGGYGQERARKGGLCATERSIKTGDGATAWQYKSDGEEGNGRGGTLQERKAAGVGSGRRGLWTEWRVAKLGNCSDGLEGEGKARQATTGADSLMTAPSCNAESRILSSAGIPLQSASTSAPLPSHTSLVSCKGLLLDGIMSDRELLLNRWFVPSLFPLPHACTAMFAELVKPPEHPSGVVTCEAGTTVQARGKSMRGNESEGEETRLPGQNSALTTKAARARWA